MTNPDALKGSQASGILCFNEEEEPHLMKFKTDGEVVYLDVLDKLKVYEGRYITLTISTPELDDEDSDSE